MRSFGSFLVDKMLRSIAKTMKSFWNDDFHILRRISTDRLWWESKQWIQSKLRSRTVWIFQRKACWCLLRGHKCTHWKRTHCLTDLWQTEFSYSKLEICEIIEIAESLSLVKKKYEIAKSICPLTRSLNEPEIFELADEPYWMNLRLKMD